MIETHATAEAMARCLISYIPDDQRIRREVVATFGNLISSSAIAKLRVVRACEIERAERGRVGSGYSERGWDWRGEREREDMRRASSALQMAIERERRA
jgi:hypothetical protein